MVLILLLGLVCPGQQAACWRRSQAAGGCCVVHAVCECSCKVEGKLTGRRPYQQPPPHVPAGRQLARGRQCQLWYG